MTHIIIDRRKNDKGKSTVNRQRFVKRVHDQVREAVKEVIRDGNIKDMVGSNGKKIRIPGKGLNQPTFGHDKSGGVSDRVYPGNDQFSQGDRVDRPQGGDGSGDGKRGSNEGEGEDGFEFHLSREEFLDMFFEDLELPDMVLKDIAKIDDFKWARAGFSVDGNPARLSIKQSMKVSKGRRLALRGPKRKKLLLLEAELAELLAANPVDDERVDAIKLEIATLKRKIKAVPFIDDTDLRYNRWDKVPVPTTQAVMFCIMDVSASMGEWEKEMAKRFFTLLYLFLIRDYDRVDIIFIRHHTSAKEVEEEEFFYSKETGGTMISPALVLMKEIIDRRYPPSQWNIFGCQASDGDNWSEDSPNTKEQMVNVILPITQYFAYVEIARDGHGGRPSDISATYESVKAMFDNFAMSVITDVTDIYPVFAKLFQKRVRNQ